MEGYVYLGAFFLIVIIFAIQSYRSKKEEEQKLKSKIEKNFGKNCDTELTADEILNIKKYYEYTISKRNGEYIDESFVYNFNRRCDFECRFVHRSSLHKEKQKPND